MPRFVRIVGPLAVALAALALRRVRWRRRRGRRQRRGDGGAGRVRRLGPVGDGHADRGRRADTRRHLGRRSHLGFAAGAHHEGTCDNLTAEPAYGLPNVADGSSDSTVDVALDALTGGEYAINLHMSDEEPRDVHVLRATSRVHLHARGRIALVVRPRDRRVLLEHERDPQRHAELGDLPVHDVDLLLGHPRALDAAQGLSALSMPFFTASSKLVGELAEISTTLATDMRPPLPSSCR